MAPASCRKGETAAARVNQNLGAPPIAPVDRGALVERGTVPRRVDAGRAEPVGLALAAGAAASYALGCCVTRKLPIAAPVAPTDTPRAALAGAFLGPSLQMIVGGPLLGVYALATGERLTQAPSLASVGAVVYLVVLGSVLAYSALAFLLQHAPPALATSYAYVNPPVALALGAAFGSETIRAADVFGLALVLVGVVLLLTRVLPTEARRAMQVSSAARDQIDAPRRIG